MSSSVSAGFVWYLKQDHTQTNKSSQVQESRQDTQPAKRKIDLYICFEEGIYVTGTAETRLIYTVTSHWINPYLFLVAIDTSGNKSCGKYFKRNEWCVLKLVVLCFVFQSAKDVISKNYLRYLTIVQFCKTKRCLSLKNSFLF